MPVKLNTVVERGKNDHTVLDLVEHFRGTGIIVRFIEYMDVGTVNGWQPKQVVPSKELLARLRERWALSPLDSNYRGEVAKRYAFDDGQGEIGFISSVSEPFCGDCHRARLSADGTVYTCLFASTRHGASHAAARRRERRRPRRLAAERLAQSHRSLQRDPRPAARAQARRRREAGARRDVPDGRLMLSHVDSANRPTMVDVGDKAVTTRTATARAVVVFPPDVVVRSGEALRTKKGPVFDTAIIAGVMAAKRTHELIPFCHPIALEDCKIAIEWGEGNEVVIECSVRATHKTGVEMEALTGASVAALTIYDMCKALTHGIAIREVVLLAKAGGKRDYVAPGATTA